MVTMVVGSAIWGYIRHNHRDATITDNRSLTSGEARCWKLHQIQTQLTYTNNTYVYGSKNKDKSYTRMSASTLQQDPNTWKVKENTY